MTVAHFTLHARDTKPLPAVLEDENGPVDLSAYEQVRFTMWAGFRGEGAPIIDDALATIVDAPIGSVIYEWGAGETDDVGRYSAKFTAIDLTPPTPGRISFPSDRFILIEVLP